MNEVLKAELTTINQYFLHSDFHLTKMFGPTLINEFIFAYTIGGPLGGSADDVRLRRR